MASRTSEFQRLWGAFFNSFYQESVEIQHVPYINTPSDQTFAAADYGERDVEDFPPPPSISVSDDINVLLAPYTSRMNKTRGNLMKRRFKALAGEWFQQYSMMYCPEDTSHLLSSYNQIFEENLQNDSLVIESDIWYAGLVEEMEGVEWKKGTAKDHFAREAASDLRTVIPSLIEQARGFAS